MSRAAAVRGRRSLHRHQDQNRRSAQKGRSVPGGLYLGDPCLEFGVGLEDDIADAVLRGDIADRPQEREDSPLAIHGVLTGGEGRGETVEPSSVITSEAIPEFDAVLARMQTPNVRRGMKAAFAASGKQLGKAAVAAARRRSKRSEKAKY